MSDLPKKVQTILDPPDEFNQHIQELDNDIDHFMKPGKIVGNGHPRRIGIVKINTQVAISVIGIFALLFIAWT